MKKQETQTSDEEDSIILSVKLASGRFESSIQVPLFCSDDEREEFIGTWLKMMEAGIRCGRSERNKSDANRSAGPQDHH